LTLRTISTFGATKCQILRLKCTKFDFHWGCQPQTPLRELTGKGRDGGEGKKAQGGNEGRALLLRKGKGEERGNKEKGRKGRGKICPSNVKLLPTPLPEMALCCLIIR